MRGSRLGFLQVRRGPRSFQLSGASRKPSEGLCRFRLKTEYAVPLAATTGNTVSLKDLFSGPAYWLAPLAVRGLLHSMAGAYIEYGELPDDSKAVAKMIRANPQEVARHWDKARRFFQPMGEVLYSAELALELERREAAVEQRRAAANARWSK